MGGCPMTCRGDFPRMVVSPVPGSEPQQWDILEPLIVSVCGVGEFTVPAGRRVDFASVPRWLRPFFSARALHSLGSVVHDELYTRGTTSRWIADAIFAELLRREGIHFRTCVAMWVGVRLGGWWAWRQHRSEESRQARIRDNGNVAEKGGIP